MTKKKTMTATSAAETAALATKLAAPIDGWTITTGVGAADCDGSIFDDYEWAARARWIRYERTVDGVAVAIVLTVFRPDNFERGLVAKHRVEGQTTFDGRTFTRRGVDGYSCMLKNANADLYTHDYVTVAALLDGELARCLKAAEARKTAEPVPGLPFAKQPAWFVEAASTLKAGRSVSLTPGGFGTGYTLTRGVPRRYATRASPALEARLGVSPIAIETFDHD